MTGSVYMRWAKEHAAARYNLANSGLLACTTAELGPELKDLPVNALDGLDGPSHDGYPPLRAAIAARYGVTAGQVVLSQGTSGANFLAFATLVEPGDEVLVEEPTYEPILAALSFLGARVRRFSRYRHDGFRPDPTELRLLLGGEPRLVVLTDPHNPSGVLLPPEDLAEVARRVDRAGAFLLVDNAYLDAAIAGDADDPPRSPVHLGPHVVATSSLTKSHGLSGLRCGWALADAEVATHMLRVKDLMEAAGSIASEALALQAFQRMPRLTARARAIVDPNLERVHAFLAEHADFLDCVVPPRSMIVFPRLLREETSDDLHDRLRRLETSIVPGRFFEDPRSFRLGFVRGPEEVARGLENLARALRER